MYDELMKKYGVSNINELIAVFGSKEALDAAVNTQQGMESPYDIYKQQAMPNNPNFNGITGGNEAMSMDGAFGGVDNGNKYSGWVTPAVNVAGAGVNAYMGYRSMKDTQRNNERNYKISMEDARRKGIQYDNLINEKNRKSQLAMGNSNNQMQTASIIRNNPYKSY